MAYANDAAIARPDSFAENRLNFLSVISESPAKSEQQFATSPTGTSQSPEVADLLLALPEHEKLSAKALLQTAANSPMKQALSPFLFNAATVERQGSRIQIDRASGNHIPLNRNILEGDISADRLNVGKSVTFDIASDGMGIENLAGVSLSVSAFGKGKEVPVLQLRADEKSHDSVTAQIANPMPASLREILSMPDELSFPMRAQNGKYMLPQASSIFYAVSESSGDTLPGLIFEDAFRNLGDISTFAEKNPKWIHNVVKPMFDEVKRQAYSKDGAQSPDGGTNNSREHSEQRVAKPQEFRFANAETPAPIEKINKAGDYHQTINVEGKDRPYFLHVPANYDASKPLPLVVMLHGRGGSGEEFAQRTRMNEKADKEGFAVVYPDATKWFGRQDLSAWDAANGLVPPGARADDLQFLRSLIDRSQEQLNIDPKRIHMIGHSSGGMMTYLAASQLSDKLASVGIVSSAMSGKEPKPKFPISVISTHGTADEVIPIDGLKDVPPLLSELGIPTFNTPDFATEFWKRQNGITESGTTTVDGDTTRKRYENKQNGTAVEQITFNGSGHTPEDELQVYDKVWQFLKEHPKSGGTVSPSDDPTELKDERLNPLRGILEDIQMRGADGIADDVATMYRQANSLPDGSIRPSSILKSVEEKVGTSFSSPIIDFVRNSATLSKSGNHVALETQKLTDIPINRPLPLGSLESLRLDDVSFNLNKSNGLPLLSDIKGVSLKLNALGFDRSVQLREISDRADKQGRHTYRFTVGSPVPAPLRMLLFSPGNVDVDMQVDDQGKVRIANESEVKNDILGVNPVTRGYMDIGTDISHAMKGNNPKAFVNLRNDAAITASIAGLSLLAPRFKLATSLAGSLIGAPAVIHTVREHFPF
jgi:polyhydroxybutyrate depolymerase